MRMVYKNIHPASKIVVTTATALICLIICIVISAVLAIPLFGPDAFSRLLTSTISVAEDNIGLLKYFQLFQSIGLFVFPALIVAYFFGGNIRHYLRLAKLPYLKSILLVTLIVLSASPLINVLGIWNSEMSLPEFMSGIENWMKQSEESAAHLTEMFVKADNFGILLFNIFLIGVIPAIGEELLFRGVIQRIFTEWTKNKHIAIWVTAIFFSALHLQFYGFIPRAVLGAMFGYMFIWSGNLWLPVFAHFVNNTAAVIAYYLYNKGEIKIDPDSIGVGTAYQIAAIFSIITVLVTFGFYCRYEKLQKLKN